MASPLLLLLLGAAGGGLVAHSIDKSKEAKAAGPQGQPQSPPTPQGPLSQAATALEQGKNYGVMMMIDPKDPSWGGINDLTRAQQLITATMTQLGWKFLNNPTLSDPSAAMAFLAGAPAQWTFTGTWTLAQPAMTLKPGWITNALAFPLPG